MLAVVIRWLLACQQAFGRLPVFLPNIGHVVRSGFCAQRLGVVLQRLPQVFRSACWGEAVAGSVQRISSNCVASGFR